MATAEGVRDRSPSRGDNRKGLDSWMYGGTGFAQRGSSYGAAGGGRRRYNPPGSSQPGMGSVGGGRDRYRPDMIDREPMGYFPPSGPPQPPHLFGGPNIRPGDWLCPECKISNFRNRTECFKCKAAKPENPEPSLPTNPMSTGYPPRAPHLMGGNYMMGGAPPEREVRPGDWECVDCKFSNFASRSSCFKCNKPKPDDAPLTASLQNWECDSCFATNHAKRYDCFKCQQKKPVDAKAATKLEDWFCPSCAARNSARRTNCAQCDGPRPGREKELEKNPDWKCGGCGIMNWSWRPSCYKCQQQKNIENTNGIDKTEENN